MTNKAYFISLEGTEGSGKTTQAQALAQSLQAYRKVTLTREPGGTKIGERIRETLLAGGSEELDPLPELLLFSAARAQLVRQVIRPALERGEVVVCDRFVDSTRAYQGYAQGVPEDEIEAAIRLATRGLTPDLTVFLDLEPSQALGRRAKHKSHVANEGWNRFDARELEFHERVRQGYLELAERFHDRIAVVNAGRSAEIVADEVKQIVFSRLAVEEPGGTP